MKLQKLLLTDLWCGPFINRRVLTLILMRKVHLILIYILDIWELLNEWYLFFFIFFTRIQSRIFNNIHLIFLIKVLKILKLVILFLFLIFYENLLIYLALVFNHWILIWNVLILKIWLLVCKLIIIKLSGFIIEIIVFLWTLRPSLDPSSFLIAEGLNNFRWFSNYSLMIVSFLICNWRLYGISWWLLNFLFL